MERAHKVNINTRSYWDDRYTKGVDDMWCIWTTGDLIPKVARHIPIDSCVLDVGIGAGIVPTRIHKLRPDITWSGCDISPVAIEYVKTNHTFRAGAFFKADISMRLPCGTNSFPIVMATELLEHLDDPQHAIDEMVRVASSRVIVTVPNENAIAGEEHVWSISMGDLSQMLGQHGITAVELCRPSAATPGRNLIGICIIKDNHE